MTNHQARLDAEVHSIETLIFNAVGYELSAAQYRTIETLVEQFRILERTVVLETLMTTAEVAEALGVSERRIRQKVERLHNSGHGVGRKVGGAWVFSAYELLDLELQPTGRPSKTKENGS